MSADGKKFLFVLILIIVGMTVDYHSHVQVEAAKKQDNTYQYFNLPPNAVASAGGAK